MNAMRKLTARCYVIANLIMAALFTNVLLFGGRLAMGSAFTAGLATGIGAGWAIFAVAGWLELRRPGRVWDERMATINAKASGTAFWILVLAVSLLAAALRSEALGLSWSAAELCGALVNLSLAAYGLSALVFSRRA